LTVIVGCPAGARSGCADEIRVSLEGRKLGRAPFVLDPGTASLPLVPLSAAAFYADVDSSGARVAVGSYTTTVDELPWYSATRTAYGLLGRDAGGL
jgi:hypothetical protein